MQLIYFLENLSKRRALYDLNRAITFSLKLGIAFKCRKILCSTCKSKSCSFLLCFILDLESEMTCFIRIKTGSQCTLVRGVMAAYFNNVTT